MKKHITTVTINPCIDKTIFIDSFRENETNKVKNIREDIAGKGINVAVALKNMGIPCQCLGLGFEDDYIRMQDFFKQQNMDCQLLKVKGKLRTNLKIFDDVTKQMTEFNEKGFIEDAHVIETFYEVLNKALNTTEVLVVDGSVPQGVDSDCYAKMIRMANEKGVLSILDATDDLLKEGIKEKPYLIKPNMEEFQNTFECEEKDIIRKANELIQTGISYICISMGSEGAMLISQKGVQIKPAISVPIVSLQGAGDAMVAGICRALWEKDENLMLPYAMSLAAATIQLEGSQMGNF